MTSDEIIYKKYNDFVDKINTYFSRGDFKSCSLICNDLIRLSAYFNYHDGLLISEFIQSLMEDLSDSVERFRKNDVVPKETMEKIINFFNMIKTCLPLQKNTVWTLYENMKYIRSEVTILQMEMTRTRRKLSYPFIVEGESRVE